MALAVLLAAFGGLIWFLCSRPDPQVLLREAIAANKRGEKSVARSLLQEALQAHPRHPDILLYRAALAHGEGQSHAALNDLAQIPDQPALTGAEARLLEGTILLESGRARDAEHAFRRAIELRPDDLRPPERLGQLYVLQLRGRELRRQLLAIRERRPWTMDELLLFLAAQFPTKSPETTIRQLQQFWQTDPDDWQSFIAIIRHYLFQDRHAEAQQLLQRGLSLRPDDAQLRGLLADSLLKELDLETAGEVLGQRPPNPDDHILFWRSHGLYAFETGNWRRAVDCLRRTLRQNPDDLAALHKYGLALSRIGEKDEARRQLQHARLLDRLMQQLPQLQRPDLTFPTLLRVGRLLQQLGRYPTASLCFEQAIRWNPQDRTARRLYSEAMYARGNRNLQGLLTSMQKDLEATSDGTEHEDAETLAASHSATDRRLSADSIPEKARDRQSSGKRFPSSKIGTREPAEIRLVDRHQEAGLDFRFFNGESWPNYSLLETTGGGVAVLDYDNDGWPDLYFPQGCRLPIDPTDTTDTDRLYRNQRDGTFADVTHQAGLGDNGYAQGCAAADFDNDGDTDLVVARWGENLFYRNNGDGTFSDITVPAGLHGRQWSSSLAWADLDRDGNLDLYVVNYVRGSASVCRGPNGQPITCNPGSFPAEPDVVYWNCGNGTFQRRTREWGFIAPDGKGLGIIISDLNGDRWPDVYVANDQTPNFLFRNLGADENGKIRFREEGLPAGAAVDAGGNALAGMGIACGDLNGDTRLDLYVTNFESERNTLYLNDGDLLFRDATQSARLASPTWPLLGFGTQAVDFDLDGHLDLFVANGHVNRTGSPGTVPRMPPQLFANLGAATFADVSLTSGDYFHGKYLGRAVARFDYDRDARSDLVVIHQDRAVALLRNETRLLGNRLVIDLHGVRSNRDGIGTRLLLRSGKQTWMHELCGGGGFMASNQKQFVIGLADNASVEELEVLWPSGHRDRFSHLLANQRLVLVEGRSPQHEKLPVADR